MTDKGSQDAKAIQGKSQNGVTAKPFVVCQYVVLLISLVGAIYGFLHFIDWRINLAINNEAFVRTIASHVRPYTVFDVNGSVLVDGGAIDYLQQPPQVRSVNDNRYYIVVAPRAHASYAPMLETIGTGSGSFLITPKRGKGFEWHYDVRWLGGYVDDDGKPLLQYFRLEIVR